MDARGLLDRIEQASQETQSIWGSLKEFASRLAETERKQQERDADFEKERRQLDEDRCVAHFSS